MGWSRVFTMLRYRALCRQGVMTYVLVLLFLLAAWTSFTSLKAKYLDKDSEKEGVGALHVHLRSEDIMPRYRNDIVVVNNNLRGKRLEPQPVYAHRTYASNHTHPVKVVPPVAHSTSAAKRPNSPSCSVIREVEFFGQTLTLEGDPPCSWLDNAILLADGRFVRYADKMALLYDVIVDPARREPGAKGGERMEEVWGQKEQAEYLQLKEGFFTLECVSKPTAAFDSKDHLKTWMGAVGCALNTTGAYPATLKKVEGLTVAIQRYEYVNLYHTMTDFFNAFLAMLMFDQHPDDVTILWVDAHPQGGLDDTWATLFGKVMRAGTLPAPIRFSALTWAAMGYNSPLNQHARPSVSNLEEFRHFFLSRHGLDGERKANCSSLNWLFIWRRDYAAHPRNKGGSIKRKIDNEDELLTTVKEVVGPGDNVQGLQLDALPMKTQLKIISKTDVLLGMHGAGLSHTLFLPIHGGLLEFYPTYWPQANRHFRAMATWRGLHYQTWQNHDSRNEKANHRTYIPPEVMVKMVKEMRRNICG